MIETALLLAAAGLAAGACPAAAWIQRRRGRSGCCEPARPLDRAEEAGDPASLRAARAQIDERIAALETQTTRAGAAAR